MTTNLVALYITCPALPDAQAIARSLVNERLVACANILPGATSVYRWDGALQETAEVVMICKTSTGIADAAIARAKALHPHALPCITTLPLDGGDTAYLRWIREQLV